MTEPFRTRTYTPVPRAERPRRTRRGVRVIVTDGTSVLLFTDTDPGIPGSRWWVTPGGGMDPGETEAQTAVRELAEETGLRVREEDLIGPVMRRTAVHGYSDQICAQSECFYLLRTDRFTVDTSGFTESEKVTLQGSAWVPLAALDTLPEPVWPATLASLVAVADHPDRWPGETGCIEESTLPVDD